MRSTCKLPSLPQVGAFQLVLWGAMFLTIVAACQRAQPITEDRAVTARAEHDAATSVPPAVDPEVAPASDPAVEPAATVTDAQASASEVDQASPVPSAVPAGVGQQLFARHCAGCHGEQGDGNGIAAVFLNPKPRNLQAGKFRLVSTSNNVPLRSDLLQMLQRGMPGSSMPSWQHLMPAELNALVDEVMRIRTEGARQFYTQMLREEEELSDEELASPEVQEEITEYVDSVVTPAETTATPAFTAGNQTAIVNGQDHYAKFGCISCHGETGRGDGVEAMFDDEQFPTSPRDFTQGIFKGGHDFQSLYRRIAYGMPGTPMPSSSAMTPEQMVDLVHYVLSLSTEDQRQATILRRELLRAKLCRSLPDSLDDSAWAEIPAVNIRMTALWWRNDADPDLQVQAAHNGNQLAIRMTWSDASENRRSVSPEEFADMAALELSRAGEEPFLGMGAVDSPLDLWHWRASSVELAASDQLMDDYPFDSESYLQLLPGPNRPDFITARAAGNPLTAEQSSAANLAAQGPGSTTFRPAASQMVHARAAWSGGRWTVVFQRPLGVPAEQGLTVVPAEPYAAAFAIWDGAFRDRASQKVVSIWNDLQLE